MTLFFIHTHLIHMSKVRFDPDLPQHIFGIFPRDAIDHCFLNTSNKTVKTLLKNNCINAVEE